MFKPLPKKKYDIIYADPPWDYKGRVQHNNKKDSKSASCHYPTLSLTDLKRLNVEEISKENCLLFMWSSSPHLEQAIELGVSWGFTYKTIGFIWHKRATNPGYYTMSECEVCLVFKKGKIPANRGLRNVKQFLSTKRQKHSSKPNEIRDRIILMFPNHDCIELFARTNNPNWDVWGNEI